MVKDGFAVDAHGQIIVACTPTNNTADPGRVGPPLDAIAAEVSADVGYCSEATSRCSPHAASGGYVAIRRQTHPATGEVQRAGRRSHRKQTVEPVIGQAKQARGFWQFPAARPRQGQRRMALVCTAAQSDQAGHGMRSHQSGISAPTRPPLRLRVGHRHLPSRHSQSAVTRTGS